MLRKNFSLPRKSLLALGIMMLCGYKLYDLTTHTQRENQILKQIVGRLEAESRIAEAVVVDVNFDPIMSKHKTTIKFLEYDTLGRPLEPKYFTFFGNIIQFQSLVVRFEDIHVEQADGLRGRSAYLFWKAFFLDGPNTQEYEITKLNDIPQGYKIPGAESPYERGFWSNFWSHALDPRSAKASGIKNAQIEAPGTKFVPGMIYTLKIEHDGGIRIDSSPIPVILKGEKVSQ